MNNFAVQQRYQDFIRRTAKSESAESVLEFLHLEIVAVVNQIYAGELVLHGGAYMRYFLGSTRYSLDLDFASRSIPKGHEDLIVKWGLELSDRILTELNKNGIELLALKPRCHKGATGLKLKYKANQLKEIFPYLYENYRRDINFNIDIDLLYKSDQPVSATPAVNVSLQTQVLGEPQHMSRKIMAVLNRNQLRDLYDLLYYIEKGIQYDALVLSEICAREVCFEEIKKELVNKIKSMEIQDRLHQLHLPSKEDLLRFANKEAIVNTLINWEKKARD